MRITNNTPLENLPEYETLSAWAKNVCQNSDIFTLADLMNTPESELLKKRNCGKRTLEELQSIKLKYSVIPVDGEMQSAVRKGNQVPDTSDIRTTVSYIETEYRKKRPESSRTRRVTRR